MATNEIYEHGDYVEVTVGASVAAGTPVLIGNGLTGVTVTATASSGTQVATVARKGVFDLSVKAINAGGNTTIAVGDRIYFTSGDTPKLNVKVASPPFGFALEVISTSGATDTIKVLLGN